MVFALLKTLIAGVSIIAVEVAAVKRILINIYRANELIIQSRTSSDGQWPIRSQMGNLLHGDAENSKRDVLRMRLMNGYHGSRMNERRTHRVRVLISFYDISTNSSMDE